MAVVPLLTLTSPHRTPGCNGRTVGDAFRLESFAGGHRIDPVREGKATERETGETTVRWD